METFQSSSSRDSWLSLALALSLLLHGLLLWLVPRYEIETPPPPAVLVVDLLQPKPVLQPVQEPTPPAPKEEIKPEPPKPKNKPEPMPVKKDNPVVKSEPTPAQPPRQAESSPQVITAAPTSVPAPVEVAPPPQPPAPEPPKPIGPTNQELDDARGAYGNLLTKEIAKHKQYPRIAQMRGWQGDVILELQLDGNGALISSKILTSSNYESLDKQALEMVKKASPFPSPPGVLHGRSFTVQVPVNFRLE